MPPAFDTPLAEIIDLLVETGEAICKDADGLMSEALEAIQRTSPLDAGVLGRSYEDLHLSFSRQNIDAQIDGAFADRSVLDGWRPAPIARESAYVRVFPPRLVHIMAGNLPAVAAGSIVRGAVIKGMNLLKLPSNDLFTATAILRTMATVAPDHPVTRSFSAVYWRGGDAAVESRLFTPLYFDKLVAWGGQASLLSAKNYIGPGFDLVSYDPKTSIALIGREAFGSEAEIEAVAELAAADATPWNQSACVSARFMFVETDAASADRFSAALQRRLGIERRNASAVGPRVPGELREEIEMLRHMTPEYSVFGDCDGRGLVIRSEYPVDFHPDGKIVNVVTVDSLKAATVHANVATQTVGIHPPDRKAELRDVLVANGAQRIVTLGGAASAKVGLPHDGFIPLQRFVRWATDES